MEHFISQLGSINSGLDIPNPIFSLFPFTVTYPHVLKDIDMAEVVRSHCSNAQTNSNKASHSYSALLLWEQTVTTWKTGLCQRRSTWNKNCKNPPLQLIFYQVIQLSNWSCNLWTCGLFRAKKKKNRTSSPRPVRWFRKCYYPCWEIVSCRGFFSLCVSKGLAHPCLDKDNLVLFNSTPLVVGMTDLRPLRRPIPRCPFYFLDHVWSNMKDTWEGWWKMIWWSKPSSTRMMTQPPYHMIWIKLSKIKLVCWQSRRI